MGKTIAPVLTALSLFLALSALAAEPGAARLHAGRSAIAPAVVEKDYITKTVHVKIKGKLSAVDVDPRLERVLESKDAARKLPWLCRQWYVTANGQTYRLNFGADQKLLALAENLNGKTVVLSGRLPQDWPILPLEPRAKVLENYRPWLHRPVVVVSSMRAARAESVKETVTLIIQGKLRMNGRLGYPQQPVALIEANGQTFVLEFGNKTLAEQAKKLDGKTVALQGTFTGFRSFRTMCVPQAPRYPILWVGDVKAGAGDSVQKTVVLTLKGKLMVEAGWMGDSRDQDDPLYRMTVNGVTYGLDFGASRVLASTTNKLSGHVVVVTGKLEARRTLAGKLWQTLVVTDLRADQSAYVHKTEAVEVRGKLVFVGLPESMFHKGVDCLVSVNGKGYWLSFAGNKELLERAKQWQNQTVVVTGTLEHRGTVEVVIVNGLKPPLDILRPRPAVQKAL
jgi:hypothetical protein